MDFVSKLPDEILLEVFEYCKLLPLLLVCKKFNEIIKDTPKLMKKVKLIISEKASAGELVKSERQHQSVYFKFNYKINETCLKLFEAFNIKSLELVRCIIDAQLFLKMLELLPHLESLSIFTTYLKNKDMELLPPHLRALKSLNIRNSDIGFLKFLTNSSIKKLSFVLGGQYPADEVIAFFKTQHKIETIEYLHIAGINDCIMTIIVQELKHLQKLYLEADGLNMNLIRNLELRNTSLECLNMTGDPKLPGDFNIIVSFFKVLKSLEIELNNILDPANLIQLQQQAPRLESLHIKLCFGEYFNHIQFRNLKLLKLTGNVAHTPDEWTRLASRCPLLECIVVKDESITNDVFRAICLEFRNLKHFEMTYDPQSLTQEIFDFICDRAFPCNIRFLKIVQPSYSGIELLELTNANKEALQQNSGFKFIFN